MDVMIGIGSIFQVIALLFMVDFIFYVKFQKNSPLFGLIPAAILGTLLIHTSFNMNANPYIDSYGSVNWGFPTAVPGGLILRGIFSVLVFGLMGFVFFEQYRKVQDIYSKRLSFRFFLLFVFVLFVSFFDFFIIGLFKISPFWRDVFLVCLSLTFIIMDIMPFLYEKK
jgi:hypothetical protein